MQVFFIVLHYQNYNDTVNCIDSIKKLKKRNNKIKIIVLDNSSPNKSGYKLLEKYKEDNDIIVELMDKNYGFSYTNNYGYNIAKKNNADIIMVINNDIIIEDQLFIIELIDYINDNNYDIICPDIINSNNCHQNPMRNKPISMKKAYINIFRNWLRLIFLNIPIIKEFLSKKIIVKNDKWFKNYYYNNEKIQNNKFKTFVPFGAFIIYTNNWIKKENIAFPSDTFMYVEEDYLASYIIRKNYSIGYNNSLKVRHLEGGSTKYVNKTTISRQKFFYKKSNDALRKYIKYLKRVKKNE